MTTSTLSASAWTFVALLLVAAGTFAQAPSQRPPDTEHSAHHDGAVATAQPSSDAKPGGEGASAATTDLEAIEAELDLLVTRMDESKGESKLDAIEKLLATLVRQRRVMCGAMRAEAATSSATCCQQMHHPVAGDSDDASEPHTASPSP